MTDIHIQALSKQYKDHVILNELSLQLKRGKTLGILGENGAGKSTLIKCILRLVYPDHGHISTFNANQIAYLPEQNYLPESLSALNIIRFAAKYSSHSLLPEDVLAQVCLKKEAWNRPVHSYSKGMRQRTAIAMMLVRQPNCLILDEPMSGLDALGRKQMIELFQKQQARGCSILLSSHHVTDLIRLCDEVLILSSGKICESIVIHNRSIEEADCLESKLTYYAQGLE